MLPFLCSFSQFHSFYILNYINQVIASFLLCSLVKLMKFFFLFIDFTKSIFTKSLQHFHQFNSNQQINYINNSSHCNYHILSFKLMKLNFFIYISSISSFLVKFHPNHQYFHQIKSKLHLNYINQFIKSFLINPSSQTNENLFFLFVFLKFHHVNFRITSFFKIFTFF